MLRARVESILVLSLAVALFGCAKDEPETQQHFPSDAEIQELIQSRIDENRAVGIVVGVLEKDGSTRVISAGDPGPEARPLGERSVFEIGSITKVFTAILLADMAARGEVGLDDPVSMYLPDGVVTMPTFGGREITLLDLTTHRSALPRMPDNFAPADPANPYADYTVDQMYEFLSGYELGREIGAEAEYSNLGVGLLGHVLGLASGMSYEDLVRERIIEPLGMSNSGIGLTAEMNQWLVRGHDMDRNVAANWDIATLDGAGALRSDVLDMLRFIEANIGPAESDLEEAMRVTHEARGEFGRDSQIALGWIISPVDDDSIIWHNGGTGGYHSFAGFDPDRGVGVVVLSNSVDSIDDIGLHLINSGFPLTEPPPERAEMDVDAAILETYVGEYALAPDFIITITLEEGLTYAQATGQQKFRIYAESETRFFFKVVDAQISFDLDDAGAVTGLVLFQNGRVMPAPRQ
ncbi:MAG: serine hydrolase [Woeseiaceae bacterium]|nr:serine hydrolase [Woeseiaceae bacterium]